MSFEKEAKASGTRRKARECALQMLFAADLVKRDTSFPTANVLRLAVYEFLFEDTPHTVVINEALEIARRFSSFEATQFINGILDAIKIDLENDLRVAETKADGKSNALGG
ncbi:MAG: hypothetical protein LC734_10585 [Acidobacteria bacterium]|nr:hypothetical protein [Acidobacteriota bacterium]